MKTMKKRVGSIAAAFVMGITSIFMQVSWLSAKADTASDGVEIVTNESEKVKLLVGDPNPIAGSTVAETIQNANSTYLLGIASQFGVFIQDDFIDTAADVESRLAVGGGANLTDQLYGQSDFDVGNGDWQKKIALQELIGRDGFAHAIVQNGPFQMISTRSSDAYQLNEESQILYKTYVIGDGVDLSDSTTNYGPPSQAGAYDTQYFRKTDTPLIDFDAAFQLLRARSEALNNRQTNGNVYYTVGTPDKTINSYDLENDQSDDLSTADAAKVVAWNEWNTAHFVYEGDGKDQTVLFHLTEEEWNSIQSLCRFISFERIPDDAEIVVNVEGTDVDMGIMQCTFVNGTQITRFDPCIFDGKETTNPENNAEQCRRLLYNFPDAAAFTLCGPNGGNIAGNILAPNADVDTYNKEICKGHLSGSLIAKSFDGCFEFGYMAYQGGYSMLSSDTGYQLELQKVDSNGNLLDNATIEMYDAADDTSLLSVLTQKDGTVNGVITFGGNAPEVSDFTTGTTEKTVNSTYYIQESKAPDGYIKTASRYYIDLEETYLLTTSNEVLPRSATITLYPATTEATKPTSGGVSYTVAMDYTWNTNGDTITAKSFTINGEVYTLESDGSDGWTYHGNALDESTQIEGCTINVEAGTIYPELLISTVDGSTEEAM